MDAHLAAQQAHLKIPPEQEMLEQANKRVAAMNSRRLMWPSDKVQDHANKCRPKGTTPRHGSLGCWNGVRGQKCK